MDVVGLAIFSILFSQKELGRGLREESKGKSLVKVFIKCAHKVAYLQLSRNPFPCSALDKNILQVLKSGVILLYNLHKLIRDGPPTRSLLHTKLTNHSYEWKVRPFGSL